MLKEVGVETIGQRLALLKAVYYLKVSHGVPIDPDHYVPPCEYSYM
jgi:bZIP factor